MSVIIRLGVGGVLIVVDSALVLGNITLGRNDTMFGVQ